MGRTCCQMREAPKRFSLVWDGREAKVPLGELVADLCPSPSWWLSCSGPKEF